MWIHSIQLFPEASGLDGARKSVDGEPPRRGDELGARWAREEQTAYFASPSPDFGELSRVADLRRLWTLILKIQFL
ncbi:Unannotated [Lentimonas sp. CC4]|nr:Unannotated [Lentimonas sp. CC4]CAA6684903.1 Unannotated [Lentimonas sp. CC6]CAA7077984.1 Unannotated [Lentimonas sp. CC4]CAA7169905.1 Unannotated [Lentimonas sp. CC21]